MSGPFGSSQWMYQSAAGFYPYQIEQSLRFNDNDSAYLSRTPASAGNRKTWTWSGWVKRGNITSQQVMLGINSASTNIFTLSFLSGDALRVFNRNAGVDVLNITTSALYRDVSAWYHIVVVIDTTQATAADRARLYVNGVEVTAFGTATYPTQNTDLVWNSNSYSHDIGRESTGNYFDGYMAEVNFIDGTALTPTSFGETKSGIWVPKAYSGSYGTNGFYLSFADSAAIGDDLSGNGNDWTANNLVSTDVLLDSPTNNFAVLNPLAKGTSTTLSEGNLRFTSAQTYAVVLGSIGVTSGKWYWEGVPTSSASSTFFGIGSQSTNLNNYLGLGVDFGYTTAGTIYGPNDTTTQSGLATYTTGDIIGVAMDMDAGEVKFYKNNTLVATVSSVDTSILRFPALADNSGANNPDIIANFGQDSSFAGNKTAQGNTDSNGRGDFYYTPPSGFLALCTANLPDPAIDPAQDDVPADYFNTVLWTGDGTSPRSITGFGFNPDFVWSKTRSEAHDHRLTDAVRGAADGYLSSNTTAASSTSFGRVLSFITDGIEINDLDGINGSGDTTVGWGWLAGNGTSSNTDGSITSTVSVNQKAGFSVVSYTAPASGNFSVGHGLNAPIAMVITKSRGAAFGWWVWHKSFTSQTDSYIGLHQTNAVASLSAIWGAGHTSSVTGGQAGAAGSEAASTASIRYCFAEVEGYSKFGSYTGNGSADGPMVYLGFRPAFVMVKRTDSTGGWEITDDVRNPANVVDKYLYANLSNAEFTFNNLDLLSNGFKLRNGTGGTGNNLSGGTYIYMAFAEAPFKYSNAR